MADLIERQAAIDAMRRLEQEDIEAYGAEIPEGFDAEPAVEALKALPSAQPRPKAKNVYYEESDHCEFKCSLCGATIGVVEGGTLDGANFKFCPWCGAQLDEEVRAWDA